GHQLHKIIGRVSRRQRHGLFSAAVFQTGKYVVKLSPEIGYHSNAVFKLLKILIALRLRYLPLRLEIELIGGIDDPCAKPLKIFPLPALYLVNDGAGILLRERLLLKQSFTILRKPDRND